ncbi:hypothetical protein [Lacrimispora celerecrescens]|uniref:hypothetical protein n=1 Tax=Lacrimispora celerecrescens TaxID=29354 RepID=UPI001FCB5FEF|nr:hypothetical protein [Lacrimispora celerecrescens]
MEEVRYYNSPITLEEAEQYIQSGLITAARAYVANGYYLRRIREDKLFEVAGYQNFEDYVRGKYNKDKGWASKCIKVNQQLSEEGNSPILSKQYLEYSTYQLVELAYMSEEQREEADPDMTVNQLKQIRKPDEVVELEKSCDITTSEPEEDQDSEPEIKHFIDRSKSTGDAYGWIRSEVVKEYLRTGYKGPESEYKIAVYGDEYRAVKGEAVTVFYNCSGDDRPAAVTFDVENTRLEREYNFFFFGNKEEAESKESEEEQEAPPQQGSGYYNPDDDKKVDESCSMANIPRASDRHVTMFARLFVQENAGMLFHGGVFYGIRDEEIIRMLKLFHYGQETIVIDNDVEVSVGAEIIEFSRGDEDLGICLFQTFVNYVRKQIDEYIEQMAEKERQENAQEQQPENNQGSNTFNSTPTSCHHRDGYSCTVLAENREVPGDGSNCGSSCCWRCALRGMCKYECNASAGRDGAPPEYDAAWFVREWAKHSPGDLKRVLEACRRGSTNSEWAKAVQEEISPYGAHNRSCWKYDFSFHGFAGGIDFRIGKVDIHLKYSRFIQELMNLYPDFVEPVSKESQKVIKEPENVPELAENVPDSPENIIDGEFVEVLPESETPEYTPQFFLQEQSEKLNKYLQMFKEKEPGPSDIKFLECQKTIVAALACMVVELERPEPIKPEQPELPILKNNDQRKEFINAYEAWPIWIDQKETGERYYRYELSDKVAMVVKVSWKHSWSSYKESKDYEYGAEQYYLLGVKSEWSANAKSVYVEDEARTFYECSTNMTALVEYLKEYQKKY